MTATALLDHSNGLVTKAQIVTLLAEAKAAQDEHRADGAGAQKRAKVAKAPPAAPEVTIVDAAADARKRKRANDVCLLLPFLVLVLTLSDSQQARRSDKARRLDKTCCQSHRQRTRDAQGQGAQDSQGRKDHRLFLEAFTRCRRRKCPISSLRSFSFTNLVY
jgi:hypothetical protein